MRITAVDLSVTDPAAAIDFFTEVLELPTRTQASMHQVTIGCSALRLTKEPASPGVHHLAFDIPPDSFDEHRAWLSEKVPLLQSAEGRTEFEGPPAWNSRSIYFEGPDRMVLELIARRERPRIDRGVPCLESISEVGIAVASVLVAVRQIGQALGAAILGSGGEDFAPVGDHDGLLILVSPGRAWLPVFDVQAQPKPVQVHVAGSNGAQSIRLNEVAHVTTG